ncbi:hypothetical protein XM38_009860 [Halomicronema hongdechloris C2206]|uniref:Uncharacterized protein n=1 Tax=Halomicronema hongdechloris C2206 TaxID=1641165 RepID=A0A1Z3HIG5_9CYAN|nr:hypothetical protein [Halomicronema hongdechloris]ASC70056.1 hypothetical protein XM38_009860 [Halomicronema hongdechloris C2206]
MQRFFGSDTPILQTKQAHLDVQDLCGLLRVRWGVGQRTLLSWMYTRIDQVFLVWGWMAGIIFLTPYCFPGLSWSQQAIAWSSLTVVGTGLMAGLAWYWVRVERLRWVVYCWAALMMLGIGLTDYGIFASVPVILMNLCQLWLGLSGAGYVVTGIGMRSRSFLLVAGLHLLALPLLHWWPAEQFLITGIVIAGSLFGLAELQWDMRPPQDSDWLSERELAFNQAQQRQRRLSYK